MWMDFHPPIPPLQYVVRSREYLPIYEPREDGPRLPPWVRQLCISHALGQMPVVRFSETEQETGRFIFAADVDSFMIAWRDDGDDVYTAVSVWCDWSADDLEG